MRQRIGFQHRDSNPCLKGHCQCGMSRILLAIFPLPWCFSQPSHQAGGHLIARMSALFAQIPPTIYRVHQRKTAIPPITVISADLRALLVGIYNWSRSVDDLINYSPESSSGTVLRGYPARSYYRYTRIKRQNSQSQHLRAPRRPQFLFSNWFRVLSSIPPGASKSNRGANNGADQTQTQPQIPQQSSKSEGCGKGLFSPTQ